MFDIHYLNEKMFFSKSYWMFRILLFFLAGFVISSVYLLKSSAFFLAGLLFLALSNLWRFDMSFARVHKALWWFICSLLAFWLVHILSLIVHGNLEKFFTFRIEFLHLVLISPLLAVLFSQGWLTSVSWYRLIIIIACTTGIYDVLLTIQQPLRGEGLLSTPITRGNMGMLIGLMAYVSFFGVRELSWRVLAIVGFICGVILSLLSGSRGGWLALVLVLFTSYWLVISKTVYKKYFWFFVVILLLVVFILWPFLSIQHRIEAAFSDVSHYFEGNSNNSLGARFEAWSASFYAFQDRPIFGWGLSSFNHYLQYFNEKGLTSGLLIGHAHNDFLLYAGELGIIGLLGLLAIIVTPLFWLIKTIKTYGNVFEKRVIILMGFVLIESMIEFSLSDQTFSMRYTFQFYVIAMLVILSLIYRNSSCDGRFHAQ